MIAHVIGNMVEDAPRVTAPHHFWAHTALPTDQHRDPGCFPLPEVWKF